MKNKLLSTILSLFLVVLLVAATFYILKYFNIFQGDLPFYPKEEIKIEKTESFSKADGLNKIQDLEKEYEIGSRKIFLVGKGSTKILDIDNILEKKQISVNENVHYFVRELNEANYLEVVDYAIEYNDYVSIINTVDSNFNQQICFVIRKDIVLNKFLFEDITKVTLTYIPNEWVLFKIGDYTLWNCRQLTFETISYIMFYEID